MEDKSKDKEQTNCCRFILEEIETDSNEDILLDWSKSQSYNYSDILNAVLNGIITDK